LLQPTHSAQPEQLLLRRVSRRVLALRRMREFFFRPEHVAVRMDGAGRRLEPRLRRVGMKRDVAWTHRHGVTPKRARWPPRPPGRRRRTRWRARACRRASPARAWR